MTDTIDTFEDSDAKIEVAGVPYMPQPSPVSEITPSPEYRLVVIVERKPGEGWHASSPMLTDVACTGSTWQEAYTGYASGVGLIRNNGGKPAPLPLVEVVKKDIPKKTQNRHVRVLAIS